MSSLRRFAGARQKVGATIAAVVLGAGVALVAAPLSASAHTATLTASAACTTKTGAAVVTWTIDNDYNEVLNVTKSDNAAIPVGTTVAATHGRADTTKTFTQTIPAPAAGKTARASVDFRWSGDNFSQTSTKPVTATVGANCTVPTPPVECVTALWSIPGGDSTNGHQWDKPQTLVDSKDAACGDLTVVTPPTRCGAYQVDSYVKDSGTTDLLKGGVLYGPGDPYEHLYSNSSYKYIQYSHGCDVQDAAAAAAVTTQATCSADGTVDFTLAHARWADANDTTDGSRVAVADAGHVFSNGTRHLTVTYEYPTKLPASQCLPKDAAASVGVATAATCTAAGTVDFTSGLVNATWADTDNSDVTDGSRVAVADGGHLFANGTDREDVDYTIPAQLTNCDATATVGVATQASCTAPGTVAFAVSNATWDDPSDVTDGSRTATAATGHLFADGTSTTTISYTIPSQLTTCAVVPPVTPPSTTPPTVTPPVVSPPAVTPATTTTTMKVDPPTVTTKKSTKTAAASVSPSVLASTGLNDSTPIAAAIAAFALLFGLTTVVLATRRARKTRSE